MAETRRPPRRHGGPPMEKPKDFKGTARKLLKYIGRYKVGIIIVLIFAIVPTERALKKTFDKGNPIESLFHISLPTIFYILPPDAQIRCSI